jgi:hypothetical protein
LTPQQQKNIIARLVAQQVAQQAEQWRIQTTQQIYAAVLKVLFDKWDFTSSGLIKVFEQITNEFDCINGKYAKIEDFYGLLEEMGVKVK